MNKVITLGDRCNEPISTRKPNGWGYIERILKIKKIYFYRKFKWGDDFAPIELCPRCAGELVDFLNNKR